MGGHRRDSGGLVREAQGVGGHQRGFLGRSRWERPGRWRDNETRSKRPGRLVSILYPAVARPKSCEVSANDSQSSPLIAHVVGARPNFMKVAPVMAALTAEFPDVRQQLIHTGQHYDAAMSDVFFEELGIPRPDVFLGVGSGSHAEQTGRIMVALEAHFEHTRPAVLMVPGDVNSTLGASLVAAKANIPVAHLEAGLRSFDLTMPEEINRLVTDRLARLLLTPSEDADANLIREGVPADHICRVGNLMVDTLLKNAAAAAQHGTLERLGVAGQQYALVTLHRPSNVDEPPVLEHIMDTLGQVAERLPVLFPLHPRTRARLDAAGLLAGPKPEGVSFLEPLGYLDFLALMQAATVVLTDSGGIQEETTALQVPCLTLRENTERPITVDVGSNTLVGRDRDQILSAVAQVLDGSYSCGRVPPLWDGHAGSRAANALVDLAKELGG